MAKVLLRKYIREIEGQIDHGQQDEAIAHCRHILRKYPKHLDTYRMLGKAYLEARRYNEATDIFHRLLMAVPDDFVAHVGMSIINDVQQNMDAAIWHMERAFEVQPSNSAIQSELQRLYSRRDGVEPPKIRLTRGALSHMYVQGELYPQAISEISGVLAEDAGRQDMQVLLARAYFHAGQKSESAEICSQLIRRYPYCLDANRVLVELLPGEEDAEKAQVYRTRVNELDPYAAFVTGSIFRSEDVPDEAVSIDHLEWDGQPVEMDAEWNSSLGIGLTAGETGLGDQPAWLKSASEEAIPGSPLPDEGGPAEKDSSDIPEFLRDAGWGVSACDSQEDNSLSAGDSAPALEQGDLPDWVKAMAPEGSQGEINQPASEESGTEQGGTPDWLDSLQTPGAGSAPAVSGAPDTAAEGELPDWLKSQAGITEQPPAPVEGTPAVEEVAEMPSESPAEEISAGEDAPDWLSSMQTESGQAETPAADTSGGGDAPDWLGSMQAEAGQAETPAGEPAAEEGVPDWLGSMQADFGQTSPTEETSAGADVPDWLGSLDTEAGQDEPPGEQPTAQMEVPEKPSAEAVGDDLQEIPVAPAAEEAAPDWLENIKTGDAEAATPEEIVAEEGAADWLQTLKEGATGTAGQEAGMTLDESDVPDWLKADSDQEGIPAEQESSQTEPALDENVLAGWLDEAEAGPAEGAEPAVFDKTDTGSLGTSETEQDQALSWLEGLAAKHGAKAEELLTKPDERAESEPEWVQQAKTLSGEPLLADEPPEQVDQQLHASEQQTGAALEHEIPSTDEGTKEVETVDLGVSAADQEEALSWLEGLAAGHGAKPEELLTKPEERLSSEPEWVKQAKLQGETQSEEQPPADIANNDQTGIFMQGLEKIKSMNEPEPEIPGGLDDTDQEEIPDWITGQTEAGDQPGPTGTPNAQERVTEPLHQVGVPVRPDKPEPAPEIKDEPAEAESFEGKPVEDLPDWLAGLDEDQQDDKTSPASGEIPEWLSETETADTSKPEPVMPSDWHPADEAEAAPAPEEQTAESLEPPKAEEPVVESEPLVAVQAPAPQPAAPAEVTSEAPPAARPRKTGEFSEATDPVLVAAQTELSRGNIPGAMEGYSKLIKKGNLLDEVIFDLRGALQRYPVEVTIWQALGDAYMRTNRLQEALDAYTKAEELLR
jgi:tetratricopeptide (TPR) repeat protein